MLVGVVVDVFELAKNFLTIGTVIAVIEEDGQMLDLIQQRLQRFPIDQLDNGLVVGQVTFGSDFAGAASGKTGAVGNEKAGKNQYQISLPAKAACHR